MRRPTHPSPLTPARFRAWLRATGFRIWGWGLLIVATYALLSWLGVRG